MPDMRQLPLFPEYKVMGMHPSGGNGEHYTVNLMGAVAFAVEWKSHPRRRDNPGYYAIVYEQPSEENRDLRKALQDRGIDIFFGVPIWETSRVMPEGIVHV